MESSDVSHKTNAAGFKIFQSSQKLPGGSTWRLDQHAEVDSEQSVLFNEPGVLDLVGWCKAGQAVLKNYRRSAQGLIHPGHRYPGNSRNNTKG